MTTMLLRTEAEYQAAFEAECRQVYPMVDAIEAECGAAVDPDRLLAAARVLACPVKKNPPNWQHGRVLYALTRRYLAGRHWPVTLLDIGTAKGFSALCLQWALTDSGVSGQVVSCDVVDPASHTLRNTVAECHGLKTLAETLAPWPESREIAFRHATGIDTIQSLDRVHVAFVDGQHRGDVVAQELSLLSARQQRDALCVVDDVQIAGIRDALPAYGVSDVQWVVDVLPIRSYAMFARQPWAS